MLSEDHSRQLDSVLASYESGEKPLRDVEKAVVKAILADLTEREPGRSVELRIPPFAAIQLIEGHTHRRGTPAAVVETDPATLACLARGLVTWEQAIRSGKLLASGERSDLSRLFPLT